MIAALAAIAAVASEALAVYTGSELVTAGYSDGQHSVSAFALVAVALLAYAWPGIQASAGLKPSQGVAATVAVAFVAIYGTLRAEFAGDFALWDFGWVRDFMKASAETAEGGSSAAFAAFLLVVIWTRSWIRSADEMEFEVLPKTIVIPFAAVTLFMVIGAPGAHASEVGRAGAAFYATAVLALVCAQLAQSGTTFGELRAGGVTAALLAGVAGAVVACVALFGLLFGIFGEAVGAAVWFVVRIVLTVVLVPFAWLFGVVANALIGEGKMELERELPERLELPAKEPGGGSSLFESIITYGLRGLLLLAAIALLLGLVALVAALRRRYRRRTSAERPASAGRLERDGLFRWPFARRHSPASPAHGGGILRLYRRVLDDAGRRGALRGPHETPDEFAPTLVSTFHAPVTNDITLAFEEARYGGREPPAESVADLERRWLERR